MNYAFILTAFILVGVAFGVYTLITKIKKVADGKETVIGKAYAIAGSGIAVVAGVGATISFWSPITLYVASQMPNWNKDLGDLTVAFIFVIMTATLIFLARCGVHYFLNKAKVDQFVLRIIDVGFMVLSVFAGIKILDLAPPTDEWWLTWHLFFAGVILVAFYRNLRDWHSKNKKKAGLVVMFFINCLATMYYNAALGFTSSANVVGSLYSFVGAALFFGYLAWFNFGIGDPEKELKKRVAYLPLLVWAFLGFFAGTELLIHQVRNKISWHEFEAYRLANYAEKITETMRRRIASEVSPGHNGIADIYAEHLEATQIKDEERAEWLLVQIHDIKDEQLNIKKAKREVHPVIANSYFYPPNLPRLPGRLWALAFGTPDPNTELGQGSGKKKPDDVELLASNQYKVVYYPNGLAPDKYFRLPAAGHPFVVDLNDDNLHFILKTRGGAVITPEEMIKNDHIYLAEQDFMIIPTKQKMLNIGINVS